MFDPQKLLEQFLGGGTKPDGSKKGMSPDFVKGLATGGVAGGLAGILLGGKTSKKLAKGAVKLGGTAALAGLAYKVYNDWQASKTAAPAAEAPAAHEGHHAEAGGHALSSRRSRSSATR